LVKGAIATTLTIKRVSDLVPIGFWSLVLVRNLAYYFYYFLCKFRNSPLKMEYLQDQVKKVQLEKGEKPKEKGLVLDVRTRWNSMVTMLDSAFEVSFIFYLAFF
jgi:hypothetical protein